MNEIPTGVVSMALLLDFEISQDDLTAVARAMPTWFRNTDANVRAARACAARYWLEPVDMHGDGTLSDNWPLLHRLEDEAYGYALTDPGEVLTHEE